MNYRHAFHAGNFADVVKHAVLALLIERLKAKDTAFRVIDTHAGVGLYDLTASEAARTGEWHQGIGRLWGAARTPALEPLLAPYLSAVAAANNAAEPAPLTRYPGSPWIARHLFRRQDRLTAVELHPEDTAVLEAEFADDIQVRTIALDGWLALGAFVPPKERRGLVLVDPPFEERGEFTTMLEGFLAAYRKWPTGIYALWYPVKDLPAVDAFRIGLAKSGVRRLLRAELTIRDRDSAGTFNGTGLVVCNPPWQFADTLETLLSGLVPLLRQGDGADFALDEIAGE
ncbi:MAG TPA: 23S rRNA (adenine(2030)-N(6))-methyltransferase RlmJ [Bauldia sp.]|nr:23S rRNA (adenine(2030)-N(6))-methyltransferase RlmJ [Bauldia sp.]